MKREDVYKEIQEKIKNENGGDWLLVSMLSIDRINEVLIDFNAIQKNENIKKEYRSTTLINKDLKIKLFSGRPIGVILDLSKCDIYTAAIYDLFSLGIELPFSKKKDSKFENKMITKGLNKLTDYYRYNIFTEKHEKDPENLDNLKKIIYKKYFYSNTTKFTNKDDTSTDHYAKDIYKKKERIEVLKHNEVLLKQKGSKNPVNGIILNINPKNFCSLFDDRETISDLLQKSKKPLYVYNIYAQNHNYLTHYSNQEALSCLGNNTSFLELICCGNNVQDESDLMTALHYAVKGKLIGVVKYLLNLNLNLEIKNAQNMTALHLAVEVGNLEIVILLINSGANISSKAQQGRSPLHYAVEKNNLEIVKYLVENQADIFQKDEWNRSPLSFVIEKIDKEMVNSLMSSSTDSKLSVGFFNALFQEIQILLKEGIPTQNIPISK
jgi:hypothetical protein